MNCNIKKLFIVYSPMFSDFVDTLYFWFSSIRHMIASCIPGLHGGEYGHGTCFGPWNENRNSKYQFPIEVFKKQYHLL